MVAQITSMVMLIGNAAILARLLGPDGKGVQQLVLMLPGLLGLFLNGGIGVANVYYAGTKKLDVETLTANSLAYVIITLPIGTIIISGFLVSGLLNNILPGVPNWAISISLLAFPTELLLNHFTTILQGCSKITTLNFISLGRTTLMVLLTLLLVMGFDLNLLGAILSWIIAGIVTLAATTYFLWRQGGRFIPRWNKRVMRMTLSFGIKGYIANLLQYFNYRLDAFLVNFFLGPVSVGIYGVSVRMAELLWQFPNAVGFVIFSKSAATNKETMNKFTPQVLKITLGLTGLGAILLACTGSFLIVFIYSQDFFAAYTPMLALLPGIVLMGGAKVLLNEIAGRGYPQYNSIVSGTTLVITIVLDLLLIPKYSVLGAAIASSVAYTMIFILSLWFYLKVRGQHLPIKLT